MKQIRKRLTYANVMSSLAVFLILGGATAFAAIKKVGANEIKANSIKTGKIVKEAVVTGKIKNAAVTESKIADGAVTTNKIANDAVTGDKVKESTLGEVPKAALAVNAEKLGGIAASGYTRNDCASLTGQIKGFARINNATVSTVALSTAGVEIPYNCSGQSVLARRTATGKYEVKFTENPAGIAIGSPLEADGLEGWDVNSISINRIGAGDFRVQIWNDPTSAHLNDSFAILTP